MSLHGSSQLPFLSGGVDGCFRKNGVSELTFGAASEVRQFSQLGSVKGNRSSGTSAMILPYLRLPHRFKGSFYKDILQASDWWKQGRRRMGRNIILDGTLVQNNTQDKHGGSVESAH